MPSCTPRRFAAVFMLWALACGARREFLGYVQWPDMYSGISSSEHSHLLLHSEVLLILVSLRFKANLGCFK